VSFEWFVALRYLREGRTQTLLILAAVSIGVAVIVFLSALIGGLQDSLIERTLGSQPHVTLRPPERVPSPVPPAAPDDLTSRAHVVDRAPQPLRSIDQWPAVMATVERLPGVLAASPSVTGSAFALRGNARRPVLVRGVEPDRFAALIRIRPAVVAGRFDVDGGRAVIGTLLASKLNVGPGDTIRVAEPDGRTATLTVAGLIDLGNAAVNETWVVTSLREAQTLFDLPGGSTTIELKVADVFGANSIAGAVAERTGLDAESWMKANAQLLVGLRSQESSKQLIQFFVVLAVALGIASVMIVSVVQKSREIGILRAVGTTRARVQRIFLIQGGVLGLAGSIVGTALGALFAGLFEGLARNPDGSPQFPIQVTPALVGTATALAIGVGLAAAVLPSRRAARLDPATVIRNA
jgi:lipoprotein-releasing system permease protein